MKKQKSKQGRKALPLHQVKRNTNLFTEAGVIEQLGGLEATRAIAAAAIAAAVRSSLNVKKCFGCDSIIHKEELFCSYCRGQHVYYGKKIAL